ncbi:MAG: hypothetical protein ABSA65_17920 [Acidimicrobiales bacterium]
MWRTQLCTGSATASPPKARLGHRGPSTTLRHYSHAVPLDDLDVADELDQVPNDR